MRRLLVLRHAKAVPHAKGGDRERELAPRGRRDAARIGLFIEAQGLRPDLALVSPSARTRETIALAMAEWAATIPVQIREPLYLAEAPGILDTLRDAPDEANSLVIVGHNPGLAEFMLALTAGGDPKARLHMLEKVPTGALAVFDLEAPGWRDVTFYAGRLTHYVIPDDLAD